MSPLLRNHVSVSGTGSRPMIFVHGYGCDQHVWCHIAPAFLDSHKLVLYDLVGYGCSDLRSYDREKYGTLGGHATDLLEICEALDLSDAVLVGHSVGAMIAVLAANRDPDRFATLILVAPSPCYLNDGDYEGGFTRRDIDELLDFLDTNFLGWANTMAPAFMGVPERPELGRELANSFCRTDPDIARHFARVTFLSDHRADVKKLTRSALILQCTSDIVAPLTVGTWLHDNMTGSTSVVLRASGHCPHLSAPAETIAAMRSFLG